ncbi:MAG: T9SS type A sorting domain-containing protein [Bacteroidota bacterium]|nr:T9SS type A sorting domain-containing protein [Bacteroidota bacterium]MDP4232380.1 T9SS type A sorting domain-containing protein [Bacteroidota bacterium]MDP4241517.1 T9SS type A sorting domain-containing protein [Bacteroidota bacterium]MDP4288251.1 T9SS type A sorting domain-containing protein [Bacteroidota bacterium]
MFKAIITTIIFASGVASNASAQWLQAVDDRNANITVQSADRDAGPIAAADWYMQQRRLGLGYIPKDAFRDALSQTQAMRASLADHSTDGISTQNTQDRILAGAGSVQWTLIGPNNIGGRIEAVAIHPTDPKTVYAGAADGGVWKTTDGGAAWKPLTDNMPALSMGSIAIDPENPNTVYAGTGELPNGDTYTGYGLYRSSDAGASWMNIGPTNVAAYSSVKVNPKHSNILYAAAGRSGGGVLRSTNTGATWEWLSGGLPAGQVTDLALAMNGDAAVLYAGVAGHGGGVYRSTDGGNNWNKLDISFSDGNQFRRISLDVDPKNWQNVVVLSVNDALDPGTDNLEGIQTSNDGGATWTNADQIFTSGNATLFVVSSQNQPQGTYDVYIRVDPSNFQHMIAGGISIWETNDGGQNWSDVGRAYNGGIHPDQHALAFAPNDPTIVFAGCDGGIFTSENGGATFDQRSGHPQPMAITQFYGIAIDQTVPDMTFGGTQDNGTLDGGSTANWSAPGGGDGGYTLVDPNDPTYVYAEVTANNPYVIHNHVAGNLANIADSTSWLNPFACDATSNAVYWGAQHLWSSNDHGSSWTEVSPFSFGSPSSNGSISALDAYGDGGSLLIGTGNGKVYVTNDNATHLTDISAGLPGRFVTSAKFSPSANSTFYVTLSGFGAGHVFKSSDDGGHWMNISSTLPDIPVNTIVLDPTNSNALYVGTDAGVFFSPNDGAQWVPYGTGLPNVAIDFLDIHKSARTLRAGTHGRSVWKAPLAADIPGIAAPAQRTVWTIGDSARIVWHGFGPTVTVDLSVDGGTSWTSLATNMAGASLLLDTIRLGGTANALVRVADGSQTVVSPRFEIAQQRAGTEFLTVGEYPYYLYDVTYDPDLGVLWATNFNSKHLYKIDPDRGTVLDSIAVPLTGFNSGNLTGIAYDPKTKHLFLHQVIGLSSNSWKSNIYEVTTTGSIIRHVPSPAQYGTGLCVHGDTLLAADRLMSPTDGAFAVGRALTSDLNFGALGPLDIYSRTALYGPRGLAFDTVLGAYLMAYTDFQGTDASNAILNGSSLLILDASDGTEIKSYPTVEGGSEVVNIRGLEYDPRGAGKSAWITSLTVAGSSKLAKVVLSDGPASLDQQRSSVHGELSLATNALDQNYPNPSTGRTKFPFMLAHGGSIEFRILDALGRIVRTNTFDEAPGLRERTIDLSPLPNGTYLVELRLDGQRIGTRQMTILR